MIGPVRGAPGSPAFGIVETRDVSMGVFANLFASIVYDETGEIARDPVARFADGERRRGWLPSHPDSVVHLRGHFFLVWTSD